MKKYIPNFITIFRVILVPFFLIFLLKNTLVYQLMAVCLFIFASISDFLDGYLARRFSAETKLGKMLDPLADKALVISAISAFIYLDHQIPLWMICAIVARDMLITTIRIVAGKKGIPVKTSRLAKAKTAFQMISILIILLIFSVRSYREDIQKKYQQSTHEGRRHSEVALETFQEFWMLWPNKSNQEKMLKKKFAESVPYFLMLFVTILTIVSGLRYIITNYKIFL